MNREVLTIIFCGPIGKVGKPAKGGYQACNRRTINALKKNRILVHPLPYPEPQEKGVKKNILYFAGFAILFFIVFGKSKPGRIFHLTGLYKHFILIELILLLTAKFRGCKTIYDVRAGSAIRYYKNGSKLYQLLFVSVTKNADMILAEGEKYINFINNLSGIMPRYFPNHIDGIRRVNGKNQRDNFGILRLIYVGAVTAAKGVHVILDTSNYLNKIQIKNDVFIIGEGDSLYIKSLKHICNNSRIRFTGPLESNSVRSFLNTSHFFIFPTVHPGEGQSNALTEAMAAGCVPIVSNNGFNSSIVGNCGRVITDNHNSELFANAIAEIWLNRQWENLSKKCVIRINTHFDTEKVIQKLINNYTELEGN